MVGTFNLVRKMPGGEKLVAITRILHRTTPDEVMDEIPTFRCELCTLCNMATPHGLRKPH